MILNDTEVWSVCQLGLLLYEREHFDEAAAIFNGLLHLQPRLAYGWYMLGLVRRAQGQPSEAAQALKNALSCEADFWASRVVLAELYYQNGRAAEAQKILKPVLGARAAKDVPAAEAIRRGRALWRCWQRARRVQRQ